MTIARVGNIRLRWPGSSQWPGSSPSSKSRQPREHLGACRPQESPLPHLEKDDPWNEQGLLIRSFIHSSRWLRIVHQPRHRPGGAVTSETVQIPHARQSSRHAHPNQRLCALPRPANDVGSSRHFGSEISGAKSRHDGSIAAILSICRSPVHRCPSLRGLPVEAQQRPRASGIFIATETRARAHRKPQSPKCALDASSHRSPGSRGAPRHPPCRRPGTGRRRSVWSP